MLSNPWLSIISCERTVNMKTKGSASLLDILIGKLPFFISLTYSQSKEKPSACLKQQS